MPRKLNRILVVDGSEVARTLIVRILNEEMSETEIITCGTVAQACAWLERSQFDLITTALMLPDKDGLELSRYVRASRHHHYTPTIVVSGDADARLLREGFAAGVTDYFDKSLGYRAFADFIKDFMQRNSGLVGRILYVEDSQLAATVLMRLMERHGLQVIHTALAEEALQLLRDTAAGGPREDEGFDIVITDFFLQGRLTGGDLLHAIRARFHYSQQEMPVLVLTGSEADAKQVEVFHAGGNDFVAKPIVEEVLMARIRSLLLIKQQFAALKRQTDAMHRLAITDSLTRVYNRRYLLDHGEQFLASRKNHPVAAVLLDIDHFKKINDTHGHPVGDAVLKRFVQTCQSVFRVTDIFGRTGGEEFSALLPETDAANATRVAERLRDRVGKRTLAKDDDAPAVPFTISIGLTGLQEDDLTLESMIRRADMALYTAKRSGRNRVEQA